MASTVPVFEIVVYADDETGLYRVGEFDYRIPLTSHQWLETDAARKELAGLLDFLADSIANKTGPFPEFPDRPVS